MTCIAFLFQSQDKSMLSDALRRECRIFVSGLGQVNCWNKSWRKVGSVICTSLHNVWRLPSRYTEPNQWKCVMLLLTPAEQKCWPSSWHYNQAPPGIRMKAGVYNSMNQTLPALALQPSLTINRRGTAPTSETDTDETILQAKKWNGLRTFWVTLSCVKLYILIGAIYSLI